MIKWFLIVWLCLVSLAGATTYYLDAAATGTNDGSSWTNAWTTLAQAQTALTALDDNGSGDIIYVKSGEYGSYSETGETRTDWLTYIASDGQTPIVSEIILSNSSLGDCYLVFDGINVVNDTPSLEVGGVNLNKVRHIQLKNVDITGAGSCDKMAANNIGYPAIYIKGNCVDVDIDTCTIDSSSENARFGWNAGIYSTGETDLNITNCDITGVSIGIVITTVGGSISGCNIHDMQADGIVFYACDDLSIIGNTIHGMDICIPTLTETTTSTTWNEAGTVMTNAGALWKTPGNGMITTNMELVPISGTNCYTDNGEHTGADFKIASVDSDTQITLTRGIADGGQPSNVDYYIMSNTHADFIQANAYIAQSDIVIRNNICYDMGLTPSSYQLAHINVYLTSVPHQGGTNFVIENNIFWTAYPTATDEQNHGYFNLSSMTSGCIFRNNIIIGHMRIWGNTADSVIVENNLFSFLDVETTAGLATLDYNIYGRALIASPFSIGANDTKLTPTIWIDPFPVVAFAAMFTDYTTGVFTHASESSLAVGYADPSFSPPTDILGVGRVGLPDAGAYEYGGTVLNGRTVYGGAMMRWR